MKKVFYILCTLLIVPLLCLKTVWAEIIDFETLPAGTVLAEVYGDEGSGPVLVKGTNPTGNNFPVDMNAAVIFDSSNPHGLNFDIGTPNETCPGGGPGIGGGGEVGSAYENCIPLYNVLIVANDLNDGNSDGLVDLPDDIHRSSVDGSMIAFDFSNLGSVTIHDITIVDMDGTGPNPRVELFNEGNILIDAFSIPNNMGNNGVGIIDLGSTEGVVKMTVYLQGSGAIGDIQFEPEIEPGTGRFTGGGRQLRVDGVRVTRGLTIHCDLLLSNNLEVNWKGNQFHMTEHLVTVECSDDPNIIQFPPAAPLDTLDGVGTGRYNGQDGFTIEFTLVDAGEPGREDEAAFLIYETSNPGNVVLNVPLDFLDGGNLQAHYDQPHK